MNRPVTVGPVLTETGFGVLAAQHLPPSTDLLEIHEVSQTEFVVEHSLADPALKRKYKIVETRQFCSREAAIAGRDAWGAQLLIKHEQNAALVQAFQARQKNRKSAEVDVENARRKLLKKQYPDTFKAIGTHNDPGHEEVRLAYACDQARLHGEAPEEKLTLAQIQAIAKASKEANPSHPFDEELALNWSVYSKMKPKDYAAAINRKRGTDIKPGNAKKRALRLRLSSQLPEGRPDNGNWNKHPERNSTELDRVDKEKKIIDGLICANCFTPMSEKSANHRYCQKCGYLWDELV